MSKKPTTKKHQNFVEEPIGDKSVDALPGVGTVLGGRLKEAGYTKAKNVLGQYLAKKESPSDFQKWMKEETGANAKQAREAYEGLREYEENFL